jgi:hypothetical protein
VPSSATFLPIALQSPENFNKHGSEHNFFLPPTQSLSFIMSTKDKSQIKNTNAAAKDAGHDNFPKFLLSYGLRIYNHDDVEEGKAILRGMGYGV